MELGDPPDKAAASRRAARQEEKENNAKKRAAKSLAPGAPPTKRDQWTEYSEKVLSIDIGNADSRKSSARSYRLVSIIRTLENQLARIEAGHQRATEGSDAQQKLESEIWQLEAQIKEYNSLMQHLDSLEAQQLDTSQVCDVPRVVLPQVSSQVLSQVSSSVSSQGSSHVSGLSYSN
jgi:uncharacterized phage infection (PIP) family protein YhgE